MENAIKSYKNRMVLTMLDVVCVYLSLVVSLVR